MLHMTSHNFAFAFVTAALLFSLLTPALARPEGGLDITIREAYMEAPAVLRLDLAVSGLQSDAGSADMTLRIGLESQPVHAIPLPALPPTVSHVGIELDLRTGRIRLGGVSVGAIEPVPPPVDNLRFFCEVGVSQGAAVAVARRSVTLPLPTVIVPGYLNDLSGKPDDTTIVALEENGYQAAGTSPTVFWFTYPSRRLSLADASAALAAYVRNVVLPATYAARINVVGYSLGGLLARWNLAFDPSWAQLVDRLILAGVPNQGAVMAYINAWYPVASLARTPAARDLLPTFPFWRSAPEAAWGFPPDARNPELAELNMHPLPGALRVYVFYGSGERTAAGITGAVPKGDVVYGWGDGIVLADSTLGVPLNGGTSIVGFDQHLAARVDLGSIHHGNVLRAAISKIGDALLDRFGDPGPLARERPARVRSARTQTPPVGNLMGNIPADATTRAP